MTGKSVFGYHQAMSETNLEKVYASLESPLNGKAENVWKSVEKPMVKIVSETGSTNEDLKVLAREGASPCLLIADKQNAGKGRQGRGFFSEGGLYLSAILPSPGEAAPFVTHLAAVAVRESVAYLTGEKPLIKWVNDVYLKGKKLCGILCESVQAGKERRYIAGIGVNLSVPEGGFPKEIEKIATFVRCDKERLAGEIAKRLFYSIANFNKEELVRSYSRASYLKRGDEITVIKPSGEKQAKVLSLTNDLALKVFYENGETEDLIAGEVHLRLR